MVEEFEELYGRDDAQYALECVLSRMTDDELARILASLPPRRAREHIRLTVADYPGLEGAGGDISF